MQKRRTHGRGGGAYICIAGWRIWHTECSISSFSCISVDLQLLITTNHMNTRLAPRNPRVPVTRCATSLKVDSHTGHFEHLNSI